MSEIVRKVLSLDPDIARSTDHYMDDVIVNEDIAIADEVIDHLRKYGLESKERQPLQSAKVLGLQLQQRGGTLSWCRGKPFSVPQHLDGGKVTRRELFSVCGQLTGHYPVAAWLRVCCGYIKRKSEGFKWEDDIGDVAKSLLRDLIARVKKDDPVKGVWNSHSKEPVRVWCDASSLAIGVVIEIGNFVLEDAAWLRKVNDAAHINVAELEAVIRGVNLALKWKVNDLQVMTNSATVKNWLESVFSLTHRARAHGIAEMLVGRESIGRFG